MRARIAAMGHYLPGPPVTNDEVIARRGLRVRPYFIRNSIGIETRHYAAPHEATSDLATEAARRALDASGIPGSAIRRILLATVSGDHPTPATACIVQRNLGLRGSAAIDIVGACSGFLQALDLGARCVATGEGPVLVIGADVRSRQLNFDDARTAFLYGDGAGAVILTEATRGPGIEHSFLTADGAGAESVYIPGGGSREPVTPETLLAGRQFITMPNGARVAEAAREGARALMARLAAVTPIGSEEVGFYCLHQPNRHLLLRILEDLDIPEWRTWINFDRCGNTTSASIPIALSEANAAGRLVDGMRVCLLAVGAGFAGGIQLHHWEAA